MVDIAPFAGASRGVGKRGERGNIERCRFADARGIASARCNNERGKMNYKIIDGEKVYGYRWIILALMGLACIVVNGSTLVFAGMAGILLNPTGPWAFDAQQFMMLTSCSYLTGFLFCMVTGTMADRMGIKKVLVIGLAISAIGAILRIFWGGFAGMFVTSVIFGFGLAALNANSAKIISLWFPGKMISVAMGIYLCCAWIGYTKLDSFVRAGRVRRSPWRTRSTPGISPTSSSGR